MTLKNKADSQIGNTDRPIPLPIFPNNYMLGSSTTNKKNMQLDKGGLNRTPLLTLLNQTIMHICMRRCGLKPQRHQVNYEPSFFKICVNVSSTTYAA